MYFLTEREVGGKIGAGGMEMKGITIKKSSDLALMQEEVRGSDLAMMEKIEKKLSAAIEDLTDGEDVRRNGLGVIAVWLKLQERRARLLGLDVPILQLIQSQSTEKREVTLRYENDWRGRGNKIALPAPGAEGSNEPSSAIQVVNGRAEVAEDELSDEPKRGEGD